MANPYNRRRPSIVRNLWLHRYLVAGSFLLGVLLWFIVINDAVVVVYFPFGLGALNSSAGIVILLSALVGATLATLAFGVAYALRSLNRRPRAADHVVEDVKVEAMPDDLPPPDYASKTTDGFDGASWPRGES